VAQPTSSALAWNVSAVPEAVREWYRSCDPLLIFVRELVDAQQATREEIAEIESTVKAEIAIAVNFALSSPYPALEEAAKQTFA
jgi:TPP-dependent pyruvate/acetoin dehydrogenase alpha subunit